MKVFLAGGTGVIGTRAVARLVEAGHDVTAIARSPEKAALLEGLGARPVEDVSLFDPDAVHRAVTGHEAVVNVATHIPSPSKALLKGAWKENERIRREGAANLADAALAAGAAVFVQESVTFGYADGGDRWIDEDHPLDLPPLLEPNAAAEATAARLTEAGGRGVVLRFAQFLAPDSTHTTARGSTPATPPPRSSPPSTHRPAPGTSPRTTRRPAASRPPRSPRPSGATGSGPSPGVR